MFIMARTHTGSDAIPKKECTRAVNNRRFFKQEKVRLETIDEGTVLCNKCCAAKVWL